MASLLATLVLDDNTMERLADRGEAPLLFQACLRLLSVTMAQLKQALATDGVPHSEDEGMLMSEGAEPKQQRQQPAGVADDTMGGLDNSSSSTTSITGSRQGDGKVLGPAASISGTKEVLNVQQAVNLAEACSQGVWGSAHYCLKDPLEISQVTLALPR